MNTPTDRRRDTSLATAARILRHAFPLPVPVTVTAGIVLVGSLALGIGGLWSEDGYLTNLLSAVTGFAGLVLIGGSALDYLTSRAQWTRTRPARAELAEQIARVVAGLCDSLAEAVRAAGPVPIDIEDGDDHAHRCDIAGRRMAVLQERLAVIRTWFTDRWLDRAWPPDEPVRRDGREVVAEFARRLEPWAGGIASRLSDVAEIWLPELMALRTDRQAPLGKHLALIRAAHRDHPSGTETVEACGRLRPVVLDPAELSDISAAPGESVLLRWVSSVDRTLTTCGELIRLLRDDP